MKYSVTVRKEVRATREVTILVESQDETTIQDAAIKEAQQLSDVDFSTVDEEELEWVVSNVTPADPWGHVESQSIRDYLAHGSMDSDDVADVLSHTQMAYGVDASDPDIPDDVMQARQMALQEAAVAFNREGDLQETYEALCRYWSV